jgi:UDP-N-acetylenolpyruvoylglucosamine reductase
VNHGDASSEDVAELIRLTRRTVKEQFNIELELEIKTLGFSEGAFDA